MPVGHPDFGRIVRCPTCSGREREDHLRKLSGLGQAELKHRLFQWQVGNWAASDPEAEVKRKQRIVAMSCLRRLIGQASENGGGFATFYGDFGGGKSRALTTLANEIRLRFVEVRYVVFVDLLDHLRELYSRHEETSTLWESIKNTPVLCVDEITQFNETSWAMERLFSLVNHRYRDRERLLTAFATHDNPADISNAGSQVGYLYSRMGEGTLVELRGDMRQVFGQNQP